MIISQTPLRISFFGGGSDLPTFYERNGGAVLSATIDKYVYVTISTKFDRSLRLSYSITEEVEHRDNLKHPLVRESLRLVGIEGGVEITSVADIPSTGSGLGSSSAFTVGVLNALYAYLGRYTSPGKLAREACFIEIEQCGEPIGKQDQYAAAFGGVNQCQFHQDGAVSVEPIVCSRDILVELEESLMLFYTGISRSASQILLRQSELLRTDHSTVDTTRRVAELAFEGSRELQKGNLVQFAALLQEGWRLKRSLANGISTPAVDSWYESALRAGALGGKLLGAGGGGFMMFLVRQDRRPAVREALAPLREVPVRFARSGSRIIFTNYE